MKPLPKSNNLDNCAPNARVLTIYELNARGLGRTQAYEEIAAGRLIARKIGRKTVILESDLMAYFANLPTVRPSQFG